MQEFTIAPAGTKALWLLLPAGLVMAGVIVVLAITVLGSRTARFEVSEAGLRIRGDLYGRFIPAGELRASEARRVDLGASSELRPRWRTFGTGLPGYQSGWFRLANGERALVYLTDRQKAVYVPTSTGYGVLLTPNEPDAFVSALRGSLGAR